MRGPSLLTFAISVVLLAGTVAPADAQEKSQRVLLRLGDQPIVAKVLAVDPEGKRAFALIPTGEIAMGPAEAMPPTDRPFEAIKPDKLAEQLTKEAFPEFKTQRTARYLYVYNCSEEFRKLTSTILETMFPSVLAYFKNERFDVHNPEFPLVIVIFKDWRQMKQYKPNLPDGVVAFYETLSNRVILAEKSQLLERAPKLGLGQAFSTIAHEGVHQILANIGIQARLSRWPAWLSEGMAEYFSPTEVGRRMRWKGVGKPNDLRLLELAQLPAPEEYEGKQSITEQTVGAPALTSTGYATAWALTNYLGERHRDKFLGYVREISQLKPLEFADPRKEVARFKQHFGDDLFEIDRGVHLHISKLQKGR